MKYSFSKPIKFKYIKPKMKNETRKVKNFVIFIISISIGNLKLKILDPLYAYLGSHFSLKIKKRQKIDWIYIWDNGEFTFVSIINQTKNGKLYCKLLLVRTDDLKKNKINIIVKNINPIKPVWLVKFSQ